MYLFIYYLKITFLETELKTYRDLKKEIINKALQTDLEDACDLVIFIQSLDKEIERIEKNLNKLQINSILIINSIFIRRNKILI